MKSYDKIFPGRFYKKKEYTIDLIKLYKIDCAVVLNIV